MPTAAPRRRLINDPGFVRLWTAETISHLGSNFTALAMPIVAIQLLNAGPMEIAIINLADTLPFLVIGLLVGALIDRLPGRDEYADDWAMKCSDLLRVKAKPVALATTVENFRIDMDQLTDGGGVLAGIEWLSEFGNALDSAESVARSSAESDAAASCGCAKPNPPDATGAIMKSMRSALIP